MIIPAGAIVCVNNDLAPSTKYHLTRQLFITQVLDGYVFDSYVAADSNYIPYLKQINERIMVVRTFADRGTVSTWLLADVVLFVKQGLAAVEINKMGPCGFTLPVLKLTWGALGVR